MRSRILYSLIVLVFLSCEPKKWERIPAEDAGVTIASNSPLKVGEQLLVKISTSRDDLSIVEAYHGCFTKDVQEVNMKNMSCDACKKRLFLAHDTAKLAFTPFEPCEDKKFSNIVLMLMKSDSTVFLVDTTFRYTATKQ